MRTTLSVVVFDLDGTLSDTKNRQHHLNKSPKDWGTFFAELVYDEPHWDIVAILHALYAAGHRIVLATGRDETHRTNTIHWLRSHGIPFLKLYMRPTGDRRDDSVVKTEMIAAMNADGFHPWLAFDDRNRVVSAWREAGVRCLQVAPGDF